MSKSSNWESFYHSKCSFNESCFPYEKLQDSPPTSDKINLHFPFNTLIGLLVLLCHFTGTSSSPSQGSNSEA